MILVVLVAAEHLWFLVLEMFLFRTPTGLSTFHLTQEVADSCSVLAMNQGLCNGFLAVQQAGGAGREAGGACSGGKCRTRSGRC